MRYGHRLSVRAATAILVVCVLATTAIIVVATKSSSNRHDHARIGAVRTINNSGLYEDALGSVYDEWVTVVAYFLNNDPSYLERFAASRSRADAALRALRDDALAHDPADAAAIDEMVQTHARFADGDQQVIALIGAGDLGGAVKIATQSGLTTDSEQLLTDLGQRIADQRVALRAAQDEQQSAESATMSWSLGIGAMCAGLLFIMGLAGFEWIGRPLRRASAATRAIAAGDLGAKVQRAGPAELANLATDVNSMAEALIRRSEELNGYLSKNLEARTAELEHTNAQLARENEERTRAEAALARTLEVERELKIGRASCRERVYVLV